MILDAQNQIAASQALTATAVSNNTIDLSVARDIGEGENLKILVVCEVTTVSAGSTTLDIQVITSAAANLGTPTVLGEIDGIPKASLVAGYQFVLEIPRRQLSLGQRYLGLNFVVNTANFSAGTFSAYLLKDVGDHGKFYPKTYVVA